MKNQRKTILIDKEVQLKIAGRVVIYWCASMLFMILPLSFIKTFNEGSFFVSSIFAVCSQYAPVLLIMLAFLPLAVYDSIKMSHRFAGPIYRLRMDLQRLQDGESVHFRFRENDFWTDIPDSLNSLISKIDDLESMVAEELMHDAPMGSDHR